MNKFYISLKTLTVIFVLTIQNVWGWGTDKVIFNAGPSAQHSMAAKQNGVLFAAMSGIGITGPNLVTIFTSTDNGDTWNIAPVGGLPVNGPVVKTKMVTTASDSVYCVFLQNEIVYIVNVESGSLGQLTTYTFKDFDVAASPNGNWIYIYVSRSTNKQIVRYGTEDGGLTWGANTALVTSDGASPRITMSGTRLILNYYGPVLVDTAASTIRAAIYDESTPGTLNPGTFQDVITGNGIKRKQYKTVIVSSTAWLVYTEGDLQQEIKYKFSQDGGSNYSLAIPIAGNAAVSAKWFDVAPYSTPAGSGITMTCLADSSAPVISSFDKMIYLGSTTLAPASVVTFPSPYNTYNDTSVTFAADNVLPVMVNFNTGSTTEAGIAWVGDSPQGPWLYFDRLGGTVGIEESQEDIVQLNVYPSPADDFIYIESELHDLNTKVEILDITGRSVIQEQGVVSGSAKKIDVSGLPSGNYMLRVSVAGRKAYYSKFIVQ